MRDPRAGAGLPALPLPGGRPRRGSRWTNLLLRPLRAHGGQNAVERSRLTTRQIKVEAIELQSPFSRRRTAVTSVDLLLMPRECHVFDPWLAGVIDQHERQSVFVRPAELVNARAATLFRDPP